MTEVQWGFGICATKEQNLLKGLQNREIAINKLHSQWVNSRATIQNLGEDEQLGDILKRPGC